MIFGISYCSVVENWVERNEVCYFRYYIYHFAAASNSTIGENVGTEDARYFGHSAKYLDQFVAVLYLCEVGVALVLALQLFALSNPGKNTSKKRRCD